MQRKIDEIQFTIPDHTFEGNNVKCNVTTGSFNIAVWNNRNGIHRIPYGVCPCCGQKVKK